MSPDQVNSRLGIFLLTICVAGYCIHSADAASSAPRPVQQILADFQTAQIPNYAFIDQIDPQYRQQMTRELTGPLQKNVALYLELAEASPQYAADARNKICFYRAQLALMGDQAALKALTEESQSSVSADSLAGKIGLLVFNWWDNVNADSQQMELSQFESIAKAHPDDDLVCSALLGMARYGAASDKIGNAARDIVDKYLTGPAGHKYRLQPAKLGRPFQLRAEAIDHKMISTADWRGKVIVIDFWATWCPPCLAAMPDLIKLYQENHDKGLEVLGISNDSVFNDLKNHLAANKDMVWPELYGPSPPDGWNHLAHEMNVTEIPTEFFIDRNGILRDIETNNLRPAFVAKLLAESSKPVAALPSPVSQSPAAAMPSSPTASVGQVASAPEAGQASVQTPEDRADALLSQAKLLIANSRNDLAIEKLNTILDKFPQSAAADKARQLLSTLNTGQ